MSRSDQMIAHVINHAIRELKAKPECAPYRIALMRPDGAYRVTIEPLPPAPYVEPEPTLAVTEWDVFPWTNGGDDLPAGGFLR